MTRHVLTDAQWAIIEPFCLGKATDPGQTGREPRLFMEAVLWIVRTGAQWRDPQLDSLHEGRKKQLGISMDFDSGMRLGRQLALSQGLGRGRGIGL